MATETDTASDVGKQPTQGTQPATVTKAYTIVTVRKQDGTLMNEAAKDQDGSTLTKTDATGAYFTLERCLSGRAQRGRFKDFPPLPQPPRFPLPQQYPSSPQQPPFLLPPEPQSPWQQQQQAPTSPQAQRRRPEKQHSPRYPRQQFPRWHYLVALCCPRTPPSLPLLPKGATKANPSAMTTPKGPGLAV
ncbi:hypothetical protein B0T24DRAFT_685616 [Lasiosphaeria ovina]|uniref:Uncharacterized protein n=1 Tax=Lasiosphaeria ovina TaxID=92902 RepID=A0AAE0JSW0_9PEZI|nr:hypothetical protein B0T24DRAFT_685616 [Lasiosphaeria ovina]